MQGSKKPTGIVWEKQKRFCDELLTGISATKAAEQAGYSSKTAKQIATRLLTYAYIQEYLNERRTTIAEKLQITSNDMAKVLLDIIHRKNNPSSDRDKIAAVVTINKMFGFNAPDRHEMSGPDGGPIAIKEHKVIFTDYGE